MKSRDEIIFLGRAAQAIRELAAQAPDIAEQLTGMARKLEAEARQRGETAADSVYPRDAVLSGLVLGRER